MMGPQVVSVLLEKLFMELVSYGMFCECCYCIGALLKGGCLLEEARELYSLSSRLLIQRLYSIVSISLSLLFAFL